MNRSNTVGALRQASALMDADDPVEVCSPDPEVAAILRDFEVVESYPDTMNSDREWKSNLKLVLRRKGANHATHDLA